MNRVIINLEALNHNLRVVNRWMENHGATWTVVTKVLCGHADTLEALALMGVKSMGDSRLTNFEPVNEIDSKHDIGKWYLRIPGMSSVPEVISLADVSLNSEIEVIEALNEEAGKQGKIHQIVIMIELGDLREGILPGSLVNFYKRAFDLPNIQVIGIGANLGCLAGAVPNVDQFMQLILYRELLELKFEHTIPMISAGSTSTLPLVLEQSLPKKINHFRIGEALFLGTDLINGGCLLELRNDVVLVEAEIAEIKEKGLVPLGETTSMTPFVTETIDDSSPGQRGYRALVGMGHLDTNISGLTPLNPDYKIAGASSDITVVNIGEAPGRLSVGDTIRFQPDYSALLRLMCGKYVSQEVWPPLDDFREQIRHDDLDITPALYHVESEVAT